MLKGIKILTSLLLLCWCSFTSAFADSYGGSNAIQTPQVIVTTVTINSVNIPQLQLANMTPTMTQVSPSTSVNVPNITILTPQMQNFAPQQSGVYLQPIYVPTVTVPEVSFPGVSFTSSLPMSSGASYYTPGQSETFVGSYVIMNHLMGIRFDNLRFTNPDHRRNVITTSESAKKELARFGETSHLKSPLETEFLSKVKH